MGIDLSGAVLPAAQAQMAVAMQSSPAVAQAMSLAQRPMGMIDKFVWSSVAEKATQPGAKEVALAMLAVSQGQLPAQAVMGVGQLGMAAVPAGMPGVPGMGPVAPAVEPVTPVAPGSKHAAEVLVLVNEARAAKGLAPLTIDPALAKVATTHSKRMAAVGKMAHDGIGDGTPGERIRAAVPRAGHTAENVAAGQQNAAAVVKGWMDSPPHRANILRPEVRHIGIDMAASSDGTPYWTQVFAG